MNNFQIVPLQAWDGWTIASAKSTLTGVRGRGGGQVVSVLTFYSNDLSSNPAEVYSFSVKCFCLKRTKIKQKDAWVANLKNSY